MNFKEFYVQGMTCIHCKQAVEDNLSELDGVDEVVADLATNKVKIVGENIDLKKIKEMVRFLGYEFKGEVA